MKMNEIKKLFQTKGDPTREVNYFRDIYRKCIELFEGLTESQINYLARIGKNVEFLMREDESVKITSVTSEKERREREEYALNCEFKTTHYNGRSKTVLIELDVINDTVSFGSSNPDIILDNEYLKKIFGKHLIGNDSSDSYLFIIVSTKAFD